MYSRPRSPPRCDLPFGRGAALSAPASRPRVGVSSCLLGESVRFDGGHKRNRFLTDRLARYVEFVPRCPEMAIGLGTPREPIHLVEAGGGTDAVGVRGGPAVGGRLRTWADGELPALAGLCGYVFKGKSPSCGLWRVPLYGPGGDRTGRTTRGLFAAAVTSALPWLPVEEEGRLNDPDLRDNFLTRVFTLHRLQRAMAGGPSPGALVAFHTDHKYLLMAHSVAGYRRLGRVVAEAGSRPIAERVAAYREDLMQSLARPAGIPRHVNVLQHLLGYLRGGIDGGDRAEILEQIERFRRGLLPWVAVRTLLRHHFRRRPDPFVERQVYLEPYPEPLARYAASPPEPASA